MTRKRRLKAGGIHLAEAILALTFFGGVIALLGQVSISAMRITNTITLDATMERQSRHQVDQFMQDIRDSSAVLASFTNSGTTYTTNATNTIVLQAPSYDSSGNLLATSDTIVYFLSGSSAPYSLHRIVVSSAGSARSSSADKVIASNIQTFSVSYFVSESFKGDGSKTTFGLTAYPTGSSPTRQVTLSGVPVAIGTASNQAQFSSAPDLVFGTAPANGAPINALYSVDPSLYAAAINSVLLDLNLRVSGPMLGHYVSQTVEVSSQANLKNHS